MQCAKPFCSSEFTKQANTDITGLFGHGVLNPFIDELEGDLSVEMRDSGQSLPMTSLNGLFSLPTK